MVEAVGHSRPCHSPKMLYNKLVAGAAEGTADVDGTAVGLADIEAVEVEVEVVVHGKGGN